MIKIHEAGFAQLKRMVEAAILKGAESANRSYAPPQDYLFLLKREIDYSLKALGSTIPSFLFNAGITSLVNVNTGFNYKFEIKVGGSSNDTQGFDLEIVSKDKKKYTISYSYEIKNLTLKIDHITLTKIKSIVKAKHLYGVQNMGSTST